MVPLENLEQIVIQVLEYQMHQALFLEGFLQLYDVFVPQRFQYLKFSHRRFFNQFVIIRLFEFFYGHTHSIFFPLCFQDHPVGSFPDQINHLVVLHDYRSIQSMYTYIENRKYITINDCTNLSSIIFMNLNHETQLRHILEPQSYS